MGIRSYFRQATESTVYYGSNVNKTTVFPNCLEQQFFGSSKVLLPLNSLNGSTVNSTDYSITPESPINNSVTWNTGANGNFYNGAAAFSRSSAPSVQINDTSEIELGSNSFCIEFWIYLSNSTSHYEGFISKPGNSDANGFVIYKETNGTLMFAATTGGGGNWSISLQWGTASGIVNTWTHVAITRNGNDFTAWRNGTSVATITNSGTIIDNGNPLFIGKYTQFPGTTTLGFDGFLQDFKLFIGTPKYTSSFTPPTALYPNITTCTST
jgi:hypothetical protein